MTHLICVCVSAPLAQSGMRGFMAATPGLYNRELHAWGIACAVRACVQARQNRGPSNIRHEAQEHETLMQGIVCSDDNLHEASAPALRPDGSLLWGTLGACWDQTVRRSLNAAGHLPQQDTLLCCVIS